MSRIVRPNKNLILPARKKASPIRRHLQMPRIGLAGFYKFTAIRPDGRLRPLTGWIPNLITNTGLDAITNYDFGQYCHVGSGNTAPANGDETLAALVATSSLITSTGDSRGAQGSEPYYGSTTATYVFGEGVAEGNLSEVGIGPNNSGTSLFSRALIVDGAGDPTTITVLADEKLNVTYQLRQYPPLVDAAGTIDISGDSYDYIARASNVTNANWAIEFRTQFSFGTGNVNQVRAYSGALGSITSVPSAYIDAISGAGSITKQAYQSGDYFREYEFVFDDDEANDEDGIRCISFEPSGIGSYQCEFDPPIPKTNTQRLTLPYRVSWARAVVP